MQRIHSGKQTEFETLLKQIQSSLTTAVHVLRDLQESNFICAHYSAMLLKQSKEAADSKEKITKLEATLREERQRIKQGIKEIDVETN